jgi:NADH-quinone oxidoreductase subunit C
VTDTTTTPNVAEATEAETEADEQPTADPRLSEILDTLTRELGDAVVGSELRGLDLWVRVDRAAWRRAAEVCRDALKLEYFCFLSGLDWLPAPQLSGEKVFEPAGAPVETDDDTGGAADAPASTEMKSGVAGGDTRFQVFARFYSVRTHVGVTLKADLDDDDPRIDSIHEVYRGADWHEREMWEMYGFQFDGHPGLRHIYLPTEFEGHPMRKDFPLLAREVKPWPGLVDVEPLPGEPDGSDTEGGSDDATDATDGGA